MAENWIVSVGIITNAKIQLADTKVELITNLHVNETTASGSNTTIELSDGSSKTIDLVVDAFGGTKVNSKFIPSEWLDGRPRQPEHGYRTRRPCGYRGVKICHGRRTEAGT
jgi:hypothetical protein